MTSSVAKLVGYGYDRPSGDTEMPLDINYGKVTEWLVERKLLPQEWTRKLKAVQAKASESSKTLPEGLLAEISGSDDNSLDYLRSKEILLHLAKTADKNLLGSLKGEAGNWERIVRAYESNMLHVAEMGLSLARNVDYEVPFFKKQVAKNQQLIADLDRRIDDLERSGKNAEAEFVQECQTIGIPESFAVVGGSDLLHAIQALILELPKIMETVVEKLNDSEIQNAIKYYSEFTSYTTSNKGAVGLEILKEILDGKTEPPCALVVDLIEKSSCQRLDDPFSKLDTGNMEQNGLLEANDNTVSLDWDVDVNVEHSADEANEVPIEINNIGSNDAECTGVNWDIEIDLAGTDEVGTDRDEGSGKDVFKLDSLNISRESILELSNAANKLASENTYRSQLLDDLHELESFLNQRYNELQSHANDSGALLTQDIVDEDKFETELLISVDVPKVESMIRAVKDVLGIFQQDRTVMLASIAKSPANCERLANRLQRQGGQASKFRNAASDARHKKMQAQQQLMADSKKLSSIIRKIDATKCTVEGILGEKLNRKINIQGEINNILSQHMVK